jgi:hypothetical protein
MLVLRITSLRFQRHLRDSAAPHGVFDHVQAMQFEEEPLVNALGHGDGDSNWPFGIPLSKHHPSFQRHRSEVIIIYYNSSATIDSKSI